ncbi:hypothetical protein, variant [Aphanomyces astaci]|uniref:CCAAT-binding factor domain-containing protein n=1 Tax=Aphanomyces astaci TaxID=112090 RepID=W4GTW1_APHAT|nr:hypothetical protein H257_03962 [Aphanomyces astaci]XP_009826591.1 hypothetical protein, variant [Aphanomyces astaci]ETV83160.1 hypothetical protein H257_03962 [Aphanomyces astaci]ETV83161.1 hypothetical protein, variant [Aphanomyces astaci]|eukprot:XP_009826590.1 hypothetical protein H257_03962 [Aphanomyces astaci]
MSPTVVDVKHLEAKIKEDPKHANELLKIMECMKGHDKAAAIAAVQSLRRLFLYFAEKGELKVPSHVEDADPISAYSKWLWEHYVAFLSSVIAWISEDDEALQVTALRTAMEIVAQQGTYKGLQSDTAFGNETFVRVVRQLVSAPDVKTSEVLSVFKGEYLNAYTDVQYFTLRNLSQLLETTTKVGPRIISNSLALLDSITIPTSDDDVMPFLVAPRKSPAVDVAVDDDTPDGSTKRSISDSSSSGPDKKKAKTDPSLYDLREHQRVFSVCWIALLKHKLSTDTYKVVLANLPDKIMPFLAEPLLLADFLTDSYNVGGITSLLALNSLFVLIQQYNFDYPAFFTKLYQLLADDTLLRSKYRKRFFKLLAMFLSSTNLPAYLIAAFAKRLSRLALTAEPGAILFIIPCVYNLVLRHKECLQLIHRTTTLSVADRAAEKREMLTMKNHIDAAAKEISKTSTRIELSGGQDPFDNDTNDPLVCHALKSSLWELFSLKQHYHAGVATKAKMFEEKLRCQMIDLADDVDISYASLVDDALKRREKQHVALAFEPCVSVLTPTDPIAQIFAL